MEERLVDAEVVCERLSISRTTFYKYQASLLNAGLETVCVGRLRRFRESSINKVIQGMAEEPKTQPRKAV